MYAYIFFWIYSLSFQYFLIPNLLIIFILIIFDLKLKQ